MKTLLLLATLLTCVLPTPLALAEIAAGDTVYIDWAGSNVEAEVVSVNPRNGWVTVRFQFNGVALKPTLPPDKVFADKKALTAAEDEKEQKLIELLRNNSDGKNVSSNIDRPWHAPGKGAQKFGPLLMNAHVKACRVGSPWFILEAGDGEQREEKLLKIDEISNEDRKYLFGLARQKR